MMQSTYKKTSISFLIVTILLTLFMSSCKKEETSAMDVDFDITGDWTLNEYLYKSVRKDSFYLAADNTLLSNSISELSSELKDGNLLSIQNRLTYNDSGLISLYLDTTLIEFSSQHNFSEIGVYTRSQNRQQQYYSRTTLDTFYFDNSLNDFNNTITSGSYSFYGDRILLLSGTTFSPAGPLLGLYQVETGDDEMTFTQTETFYSSRLSDTVIINYKIDDSYIYHFTR